MSREGGYFVLQTYPSKSSFEIWEVRRGSDSMLYCTCWGWRRNAEHPKTCTHCKQYIKANPGTVYDLRNPIPASSPAPVGPTKRIVARRPVATIAPPAVVQAPANWRELLLKERDNAAKRGVVTPQVALEAFARELDFDQGGEIVAVEHDRIDLDFGEKK